MDIKEKIVKMADEFDDRGPHTLLYIVSDDRYIFAVTILSGFEYSDLSEPRPTYLYDKKTNKESMNWLGYILQDMEDGHAPNKMHTEYANDYK